MWAELEGLAASFLDDARLGGSIDPWLIAWALDIEVRTGPPGLGTYLCGDTIFVDPRDRLERQGFGVAHECAHELLVGARLPNNEPHANGLASCLLMPRIDFARHLRQCAGDLYALRVFYPWVSAEALARRVVSMSPCIAWIWDHVAPRRRRYSVITPGHRWPFRRPLAVELEAMEAAIECGAPVESVGGVRAWPLDEPGFRRVICVSDLEVLAAYV